MKLYASILALYALSTADAFTAQPRAFSAGTSLFSSNNKYTYLGKLNGDGPDGGPPEDTRATAAAPAPGAPGFAKPPVDKSQSMAKYQKRQTAREGFSNTAPVTVQGGTLRTCSFEESVSRVTVYLKTEGRPLNANLELWQGPDNSPQRMTVYLEDGSKRPFCATLETPGSSNSVAIRNTGQMEFPLYASLDADMSVDTPGPGFFALQEGTSRIVQGGAVYTTPFPPKVEAVQVMLKSDGRPLTARVELLQGPNNNKQVLDVYCEDGNLRPFYCIVDTPGSGNVVRIVNTATVEFPLNAVVEAYITDETIIESADLLEMESPGPKQTLSSECFAI